MANIMLLCDNEKLSLKTKKHDLESFYLMMTKDNGTVLINSAKGKHALTLLWGIIRMGIETAKKSCCSNNQVLHKKTCGEPGLNYSDHVKIG